MQLTQDKGSPIHRGVALQLPRLKDLRGHGKHAADGPVRADHRRNPLLVKAVLAGHQHPVILQIRQNQLGQPQGIVGFASQKDDVERLLQSADLVQMQGAHRGSELLAGDGHKKAAGLHCIDVRPPLVNQNHIVAGGGKHSADNAAGAAGTDHGDFLGIGRAGHSKFPFSIGLGTARAAPRRRRQCQLCRRIRRSSPHIPNRERMRFRKAAARSTASWASSWVNVSMAW